MKDILSNGTTLHEDVSILVLLIVAGYLRLIYLLQLSIHAQALLYCLPTVQDRRQLFCRTPPS